MFVKKAKLVWCLTLTILFGFSNSVNAEMSFFTPFNDFTFGSWSGQGNLTNSQDGCIVYRVKIFGNFYIYQQANYLLRADPISTGGVFALKNGSNSLPYRLDVTDLHGAGTQTLSPSVYSSALIYNPYCTSGSPSLGPNAQLTMIINQTDMYSVPAGTYSSNVRLTALRENSSDSGTQNNLRGSMTIPTLAQVSRIDDISLNYDGVSPSATYNEPFCVYTNTGSYTVTPSSTTMSAGVGSFALGSGVDRLEYTVRVSASANASAGTVLTNGQTSPSFSTNQSIPYSVNCNNGDNAAVYLRFAGSSLQSVPAGNYSGVLNLMVAPI